MILVKLPPNNYGFILILVNNEFVGALWGKPTVEIYQGNPKQWLIREEHDAIIADQIMKDCD